MINSSLVRFIVATLLAMAGLSAVAQPHWPDRPIKIIVAYAAGSTGDGVMRLLADDLRTQLGQAVVIEDRAGAGGNIGSSAVAHAAPDGYTFLVGAANNYAINQYLYKNMGFDPVTAFDPVITLVDVPAVVFINASLPVNTFKQFADYAGANPGKLNYGSPGKGTPPHLAAELINQSAHLGLQHIPYNGSPQTVSALLANEVQMILAGSGVGAQHVRSGKLKAIAVGAKARLPEFPDAPTLAELGLDTVKASTWWGVAAPKGTPPDIVEQLNRAFREALANPRLQEPLRTLGTVPIGGSASDMRQLMVDDSRYWERALSTMHVNVE